MHRAVASTLAVAAVLALAPAGARAGDRRFERALADLGAPTTVDAARRLEAVGVVAAVPAPTAPGDGVAPDADAADRARARATLVAALADPSADVRAAVADALAHAFARDRAAVEALRARCALEPDETIVAALLLAVGAAGDARDVGAVGAFLGAASLRLRAAAATALGDLAGREARARLLAALAAPGDDPDWALRGAIFLALARCGTREDAGVVLVAYREGGGAGRWFARAALASAVAALDADPVPLLDRLVADDDPRVSVAAATGFVRAGRPDEVLRRLADPRPGVRAACAAAVADTGLAAGVALVHRMATDDPERSVRWSAVLALSRLDEPASDALLVEGVGSDDPRVWASAIAECRRKTGADLGRDPDGWRRLLARRRKAVGR